MNLNDFFFNTEDYELTKTKIDEGSFSKVFIVVNKKDNQQYAAKIFNITDGFDSNQQMLFLRESLSLYKLNHPSIVKFKGINFHSFDDPSKLQPIIITEYIKNGSLRKYLSKEECFNADPNWTPTKKYINLLGICNALRYLHKNKIIHHNLKPENILIDDDYNPKICGFGLSHYFPYIQEKSLKMAKKVGEPLYMAPELLIDDEPNYDQSVDVYAFGILAFEIVTGEKPFGNIPIYLFTHKILSGERPKIPDYINKMMSNLISRCWSQKPENRPSFDEIFEILSNNFSYSNEKVNESDIADYLLSIQEEDEIENFHNGSVTIEQYLKQKEKRKKFSFLYLFLITLIIILIILNILFNNDKFVVKKNSLSFQVESLFFGLYSIISSTMKAALNFLEQLSNSVNSYKMFDLGVLYENGKGVDRNYAKAIEYYEKSAELGNSNAMNNLGVLYKQGKGVDQNYAKAIEYYKKSAELGNSYSMYNLGIVYENGEGVDQNYAKAIEYFKKSAELGNSDAMYHLGILYEDGKGVDRNYAKAIEYYKKSAELGNSDAMNNLGVLYEDGKGVDRNYAKAIEYFKKSAELGNSDAMYHLGFLYKNGKGVDQNYAKAIEYYKRSAELGDSYAMCHLGILYKDGEGIDQNYTKAVEYFKKSVELGNSYAMCYLGILYKEGIGVDRNYTKAIEYFKKSEELGNSYSMNNLGALYENGEGVDQNYTKAIEYFKRSVELGNSGAMYHLGILYENGKGVEQNYIKAIEYYKKSAEFNFSYAKDRLCILLSLNKVDDKDLAIKFKCNKN